MYITKTDALLNSLWPTAITIQISKSRWSCHKLQKFIIPAAVNSVSGIDFICCNDLHKSELVIVY